MMRMFVNSLGSNGSAEQPAQTVTFGLFTDLHYADLDTRINGQYSKYYRDGDDKLAVALTAFQNANVDFVICLGDFFDAGHDGIDTSFYDKAGALTQLQYIQSIYDNINVPRYMVLGNHDHDRLTKAEFINEVDITQGYYYFDVSGTRFIVLDSCYYADSDSAPYVNDDAGTTDQDPGIKMYVNPAQRTWLTNTLSSASGNCIVFIHAVMDDTGTMSNYFSVQNRAAVRTILENSGKVLACFYGHEHTNRHTVINGIDYYLMEAMTKGAYPANAYSIITVTPAGAVTIQGYGNQTTYN